MPQWCYRPIGSKEGSSVLVGTWATPFDWQSPPGKLLYFSLPPGRYEFYRCGLTRSTRSAPSWHIGAGGIATNTNPYHAGFDAATYPVQDVYAKPFSIRFEGASRQSDQRR